MVDAVVQCLCVATTATISGAMEVAMAGVTGAGDGGATTGGGGGDGKGGVQHALSART